MLGIFQTKKAEYNKLILKSLITGPKITKQIAEYLYFNRKQEPKRRLRKAKEPNENEVKKIVSIISRKGSRLDELEKYGYTFQENNLWQLTTKGTCVALTLFKNIMEVFPYIRVDLTTEIIEREFYKIPVIKSLTKIYPKEKMDKLFTFGKTPEYLQFWKDYANELISQGVDLDGMNENQFRGLLIAKGLQHFFAQEISDLSKEIVDLLEKQGAEP